ncbi:hypothetical protein [Aquibacillus rhizosphaerae]|uniref:KTSC domain-containing protein n=1 Tax=Aquibacillus rhizosphaerae TaxID=3051431 RepID=A0ABT7LA95_9BACI|nr:hypothetical protein [Aquibacillus sp. LR5S19]MDL4841461.1 hypothetical protein [Aquibacillus sp. LR5S19]
MKITTFNRNLWDLKTFNKVSYDKNNKVFVIYFYNGSEIKFFNINDEEVFQFVITIDKESFLKTNLLTNYPYIEDNSRVSKPS